MSRTCRGAPGGSRAADDGGESGGVGRAADEEADGGEATAPSEIPGLTVATPRGAVGAELAAYVARLLVSGDVAAGKLLAEAQPPARRCSI